MSGFGLSLLVSCDQKSGIEPRFCTTLVIGQWPFPTDSSATSCSVSTSFATRPLSLTPRFKYRVPAKCRERRAIRVTVKMRLQKEGGSRQLGVHGIHSRWPVLVRTAAIVAAGFTIAAVRSDSSGFGERTPFGNFSNPANVSVRWRPEK
jgi:hypothetical protein